MGINCTKLLCFQKQSSETIDIPSNMEISPASSEDYHMRPRSLTYPMPSKITKITKEFKKGRSKQTPSLQQF